jgi:hypothetical protein
MPSAELIVLYNPNLTRPDCTHERIGVVKIDYVPDEDVEQPTHPLVAEMLESMPFMVAHKARSTEEGLAVGTFYLVLEEK